jgi:hypothetical protein
VVPEVTELPNEKAPIELTCQGDVGEKKVRCQAQGFVPKSLVDSLPESRIGATPAGAPDLTVTSRATRGCKADECIITNRVKKSIKRQTGEVILKLKLNRIGQRLLREKRTFDSVVKVTRAVPKKSETTLEYLVRLVRSEGK